MANESNKRYKDLLNGAVARISAYNVSVNVNISLQSMINLHAAQKWIDKNYRNIKKFSANFVV